MKITKQSWFFHSLGLLVLVMTFGVMFVGCDAGVMIIGGGAILGGIIGSALDHAFIGTIVGIIIAIIIGGIIGGSSSRGSSSRGSSVITHMDNRTKYPNKCISCTKYLSRGVCRLTDTPVSEMDSCSSWC